jgi:hypothetical protein
MRAQEQVLLVNILAVKLHSNSTTKSSIPRSKGVGSISYLIRIDPAVVLRIRATRMTTEEISEFIMDDLKLPPLLVREFNLLGLTANEIFKLLQD